MKNSNGKITMRAQSFCRRCRNKHNKNSNNLKYDFREENIEKITSSVSNNEKPQPPSIFFDKKDEFKKDWDNGISLVDLAKKYRFSYPDKSKLIAKSLGLKPRKRQKLLEKMLFKINTDKFSRDWEDGLTLVELSNKYNLSRPDYARKIAEELELSERENVKTKIFQNMDKEKFIQMYNNENIKVATIVKEFGFPNRHYVRYFAKKIGLSMRSSGFPSGGKFELLHKQFKELWENNIPVKQIEKKLEITDITIHLWKKKLNLKNRQKGKKKKLKLFQEIKDIEKFFNDNKCGTLSEISIGTKFDRSVLKKFFNISEDFQIFPLIAENRSLLKLIGNYVGDDIIIKKEDYRSGYIKLLEILTQNQHDLNKYQFSSYAYSIFHKKPMLSNNSEFYEFLDPSQARKNILDYEKNSLIFDQCNINTFGYNFEPEKFIEKLNNSDKEEQKILLKSLFYSLNFQIIAGNNMCDFFIKSEKTIPVKLEVYRKLTKGDLQVYSTSIKNKEGVIITLQEIDESITSMFRNIIVYDKITINDLLKFTQCLPARKNSFCIIQEGTELNLGKIVQIKNINFEENFAIVEEISNEILLRVPLFSLKELDRIQKINKRNYSRFLKNINLISKQSTEYSIIINDIVIIYFDYRYGYSIKARIGDNIVSLNYDPNLEFVGTNDFPSSIGYCRNELIQCNCLEWHSQQDDYYVCKHLIFFLYHIFENELFEKNNLSNINEKPISTQSIILSVINEIDFLLNRCYKIEKFWREAISSKLNQDKRKAILYNYLISDLISENNYMYDSVKCIDNFKKYLRNEEKFSDFIYEQNDFDTCYNEVKQDIENSSFESTFKEMTPRERSRLRNSLLQEIHTIIFETRISHKL